MKKALKGKKLTVPATASLWYLVTSVITKAAGLLVTPIFTRILSGEEYGEYSLYMSYLGLFSLICATVYSGSVIYKGLQDFSERTSLFLSSALGFNLCFCASVGALLFALSGVFGVDRRLSLILSVQLIVDGAVGLSLMRKRYYYSYKTVALVGVIEALGAPALSLILLYGTSLGFAAKLWGLLIPALIAAAPLALGIIGRCPHLFDKGVWKYLAVRSLSLLPSAVLSALSANIGSFVIARSLGTDSLARYSVTHSVGIGLTFVITALGSSLAPWITRKLAAKKENAVSEVTAVLFTLLCSATLFLIAVVPEALALLAPREYAEAAVAALPIALATLPSFITSVASVGLVFGGRGGAVSFASALGAITNLSLSILLIPWLNYFGAGAALLLSSLLSAAACIYFIRKKESWEIVKIRRLLPVFLITAALGAIITLFYNYAHIRILLLTLPTTAAFFTLPRAYELIKEKSCHEV